MAAWNGWERQLLHALGMRVTHRALADLAEWQRREGGTARWNPLNTTQHMPGAGSYNSVGVRDYSSAQQGLAATVRTLRNGHYSDILHALQTGQPLGSQAGLKTWGTGRWKGGGGGSSPGADVAGDMFPSAAPSYSSGDALMDMERHLALGDYSPTMALASLEKVGKAAGRAAVSIGRGRGGMPVVTAQKGRQSLRGGWEQWVHLSPGADRPGAHTSRDVLAFVGSLGRAAGRALTIGTGTNHNQFVVGTNRQSDHWTGHASDIPATGAALTRLGRLALIQAGMPRREAMRIKGGLFNIGRYQIIFNSMEGGNHFNHLHVGVRR